METVVFWVRKSNSRLPELGPEWWKIFSTADPGHPKCPISMSLHYRVTGDSTEFPEYVPDDGVVDKAFDMGIVKKGIIGLVCLRNEKMLDVLNIEVAEYIPQVFIISALHSRTHMFDVFSTMLETGNDIAIDFIDLKTPETWDPTFFYGKLNKYNFEHLTVHH